MSIRTSTCDTDLKNILYAPFSFLNHCMFQGSIIPFWCITCEATQTIVTGSMKL